LPKSINVLDLKIKIEPLIGIAKEVQVFHFNGSTLHNVDSLSDKQFENDYVIVVQ
jgi:hypothetical protein